MPGLREEEHLLEPEEAVEHGALSVLRNAPLSLFDAAAWLKASVKKDPTVVYDLNGKALFYICEVGAGDEVQGTVHVAASRVLGGPELALEIGRPAWNYPASVRKLTPVVKREFPGARISAPKLVCYSYPKLGVAFEVAGMPVAIYDVASLDRIPPRPDKETEGAYAWSYYESLGDERRRANLALFRKADKARDGLPARTRTNLRRARSLGTMLQKVGFVVRRSTVRKLPFSSNYAWDHARGHHCFELYAQQVNDYCAVATCQMVLAYYRYYFGQNTIAPSLGYSAGSGCPPDQSPGYKSLTCNHLDAAFDSSPTFAEAVTLIDGLHPFKSGIPGHARACAGYSISVIAPIGRDFNKLLIYDPWPWNADMAVGGAIRWEDWSNPSKTNYVTTKIKCP
jgi:hypothetical protein